MMKRFTLALSGCLLLISTTVVLARQDCNASRQASTPSQRFKDHGNGTLTDTRSGLMWKKCLEGQSGGDCAGSPQRMSWDKALNNAQFASSSQFAGYRDWRLPTVAELGGLVETSCVAPAVNLDVFPHMIAAGVWSGSQSDPRAWSLNFAKGKTFENFKGAGMYVRLVRDSR